MSTKQKLFSEFPPITTQQWEEIIIKELKGADYEKKLIWKSNEGITVKPYYRKEDIESIPWIKHDDKNLPLYRSHKTQNNNWIIFEEVYVGNIQNANKQAIEALNKGAEGIEFIIQEKIHYDLVHLFQKQSEFSELVNGINLETTPIRFVSGCSTGVILSMLDEEIKKQKLDKTKLNVSFDYDPIGHLTLNGNFFVSEENTFEQLSSLIKFFKQVVQKGKLIGINGYFFQNAGSTIVQEIALSLAIAAEYFTKLSENEKHAIEEIANLISLNMGVGSNYFMEIAKLRAIRYLWGKLLEAFDQKSEDLPIYIHTITSNWNKTAYDPYVNLLRNTTEAMSAVLGGTDSLTVRPFDAIYKSSDAFSQHLARNIQLILKEEAHLDKVIDPAGGSYYIESLTNSLIEEGWKLFMQIQDMGGYIAAFKEGKIQEMIENTQQKRDMHIAMRQEILLGTNQYPNLKENISQQVVPCLMAGLMPSGKPTVNKPIKLYRGAQAFEDLRLETEKMKRRPKVFLFTYGNLAMRKARANFSINFFGCAGFEIIDNPGFSTIQQGIDEVRKTKPEFVVICSSDEEYPEIVPVIIEALKNETILVLAGFPKDYIEHFKTLGLQHYIHIKSNVLETLKQFQSIVKQIVIKN
ncbi:MAG: methylmalonyl-CoA mutase small subunit [Bacteroidales bacterium]|nr:methylmalonyl-CoA mutase small subunit [Bacteroidales bacterium]